MSKNVYQKGAEICDELFRKTCDPRYHNMREGFKFLEKEHEKEDVEQREL